MAGNQCRRDYVGRWGREKRVNGGMAGIEEHLVGDMESSCNRNSQDSMRVTLAEAS